MGIAWLVMFALSIFGQVLARGLLMETLICMGQVQIYVKYAMLVLLLVGMLGFSLKGWALFLF